MQLTFVRALADGADELPTSVDEASKGFHVGLAAVAPEGPLGAVVHQPKYVLEERAWEGVRSHDL